MKITLNGREESVESGPLTVAALLKLKGVPRPEAVSVELNGTILKHAEHATREVRDGDHVEFLYFMGGGAEPAFETRAVHAGFDQDRETGATSLPVHESAAFAQASAGAMEEVFAGRRYGHVYSRISNPPVEAFELRMNALEGGAGAVATASGMAAIAAAALCLAGPGDRILAARSLFGGTVLLFNDLRRGGVVVDYVDATDPAAVAAALDERTRMIFVETIGNPRLDVPDIGAIGKAAAARGVPLVVDGTLTTPWLFRAQSHGVSVVVHSATKYITGNGTAIGGVLVDLGSFDWTAGRFTLLAEAALRAGPAAFLVSARKRLVQNAGGCLSPFNAFLHNLGLETLALRMDRHCANALALARHLAGHPGVASVNYPGLDGNPFRAIAERQFGGRYGGMLTLRLGSRERAFAFIDRLKLAKCMTNLGDAKTLVLHPASTIFRDCSPEETAAAGVTEDLVRVSVGIEGIADLIGDFNQALAGAP